MSAAVTSSVLPYALVGLDGNANYQGSVVSANPTATTLFMQCMPDTEHPCNIANASVTFGPWAQATPPPGASTGSFDMLLTMSLYTINETPPTSSTPSPSSTPSSSASGDGFETVSVHCDIASTTVPTVCTSTHNGPYAVGMPTETASNPDPEKQTAARIPITITAGLEKLASLTSSGSSSSSSSSSSTSGTPHGSSSTSSSTGTSHTGTSSTSSSASKTASSAADPNSHTGAASTVHGASAGTVGLLGLLAALVVH